MQVRILSRYRRYFERVAGLKAISGGDNVSVQNIYSA